MRWLYNHFPWTIGQGHDQKKRALLTNAHIQAQLITVIILYIYTILLKKRKNLLNMHKVNNE